MDLNAKATDNDLATGEDLNKWYNLQQKLEKIKEEEMALRKKIARTYFQKPKEGTNSTPLTDGWVLKLKHTINRSLDEGVYSAMRAQFREMGIPEDIVVSKPTFVLKEYRELTEEQMKFFDQCLKISDGAPSLEIVLPKRR